MRLTTERQNPLHRSGRLWDITSQLRELARDLRLEGLDEEARSLETTIRDLDWQSDALLSKEVTTMWAQRSVAPSLVGLDQRALV